MIKKRFGEILTEKKIITDDQLKTALDIQKKEGGTLGQTLVRLGYVPEDVMSRELSEFYGIPYLKLSDYEIDSTALSVIPEEVVRKYSVLPLDKIGKTLTVAISDFNNVIVLDELRAVTGCQVIPLAASSQEITAAIDKYYKKDSLEDAIKDMNEEEQKLEVTTSEEEKFKTTELQAQAEDAPAVKLVSFIIMQAIDDRASDIHIEPYEDELRIRLRIDGVLYEINPQPPKKMHKAIVSRIKILANLDIAEQRLAQDGRLRVKARDKIMDLRISTLPTIFGEKVVMRILDKTILGYDFKQLGVEPEDVGRFEEAMDVPYGMILVTGPTSCGKTTTLYTILNQLNSSRDNLITVEDPVEYQIRGINQMQVRPDIGLTWEIGLRAILRQDPDTIMIGEIRDLESVEMAIKSALTGHLVLSTIHTNSACATISRLINMGAEPFLITASLVLVVSQRLIRNVCPQCKEAFKPLKEFLDRANITGAEAKNIMFYRGTGCDYCRNSGYRGRAAIFEVLTLNRHLKELILEGATPPVLEEAAKKELGFRTMGEIAISKARKGITTLEEALSLTIAEE
ncbi:hypothetical protein AUJ66_00395 [Candidatus Desantisbacteria bacterium CG1_02_38_46]|uniref:Type II secretion system protein GspE n=2 Tax=unclassified Candidatus Desantisiibacteriota TaxID=3106372 RepID=A0A2H9PC03_9BACT|nr:MAG: hypothetical protein AUJ66_00395 [Candidatus Desantisbacteria bacterium CG1_02_38_46]PIZ16570.1 MAG: type II secretion system protein GspE [Candidatus Desantisbacteria bacterium CG_4_10_14_0_8_um_filter_39_17]